MAWELHLAHWTTSLAELEVFPNWTYGGRFRVCSGGCSYSGQPVFGFSTTAKRRAEATATRRYLYIDTLQLAVRTGLAAATAPR